MSQKASASACSGVCLCSSWHSLRLEPVLLVLLAGLVLPNTAFAERLAVLDFRAAIGGAPPDFGVVAARFATEAFGATGKYEVISYALVREELAARKLLPPFGVGHIQLLADTLDADVVVHGSVRSLTYNAEKHSGSVVLVVEMVEGVSGHLKKRVESAGSFTSETRTEPTEILMKALLDAVRRAVASATGVVVAREAAEATVPASTDRPIGLNHESPSRQPDTPLPPALLPPVDAGQAVPLIATPAPDLKPGASGTTIVVQQPQRASGPGGQTTPSREKAGAGQQTRPFPQVTMPEPEPQAPSHEDQTANLTPLVRAKILAKLGPDRVLITLGGDSAVSPKMEMDVYRVTVTGDGTTTRRKLGRIRVVRINPTDAEARILEGADLMTTGDYAFYFGD